jgi:hypothetical protein
VESPKVVTGLVIAVLAVWLTSTLLMFTIFPNTEQRGQVGDAFGAVNSLFTALAFFGIVVSLFLQGRDLRHQRKELRLSREAQQETADAMQQQLGTMNDNIKLNALSARENLLMMLKDFEVKSISGSTPSLAEIQLNKDVQDALERLQGLADRA